MSTSASGRDVEWMRLPLYDLPIIFLRAERSRRE